MPPPSVLECFNHAVERRNPWYTTISSSRWGLSWPPPTRTTTCAAWIPRGTPGCEKMENLQNESTTHSKLKIAFPMLHGICMHAKEQHVIAALIMACPRSSPNHCNHLYCTSNIWMMTNTKDYDEYFFHFCGLSARIIYVQGLNLCKITSTCMLRSKVNLICVIWGRYLWEILFSKRKWG